MSGTELIMGMGEVINYLKELEEENKKLKEKNNKLVEYTNALTVQANADNEELQSCIEQQEKEIEDHKVKEEHKNKLNVSETNLREAESELESFQNFTRDYDYEDNYNDWLKGNHDDYSGIWIEEWCSENLDKYEDGDDWDWGYGYIVGGGEYRIHMAGGGDHWEDYVMDKNGCFIHNKEGKKKVFTFVSCPAGNYIKVWDTPNMEGGLVLDDGETDMYEMVKDAYEEEIMNYEPEEE